LLRADPSERYASAAQLVGDLRAILRDYDLNDLPAELRAYFADPRSYSDALLRRLVNTSLRRAEELSSSAEVPRALAYCDRVLALSPNEPRALRLLDRLTVQRRRKRVLLAVAGILLAATGGALVYGLGHGDDRPPTAEPRTDGGEYSALALADVRPAPGLARDGGASVPVRIAARDAATSGQPFGRQPVRRTTPPRRGELNRGTPVDQPDAALLPWAKDASRPRSTTGQLLVKIGPWCKVWIDGAPTAWVSPSDTPLILPVGIHRLKCVGRAGTVSRIVEIRGGETTRVEQRIAATVAVRLTLSRGDGVRIGEAVFRKAFQLAPSRYRVELLSQGQTIDAAWINILADCTLADRPRLGCRP
jgi:hypothetical protein